jgi:hypothetical protein
MSAKNRSRMSWAALGMVLLALDGASLLGAHRAWVWLEDGGGASLLSAGRPVAKQVLASAEHHVARAASNVVLRAIEQTTSVYALMDSVTPGPKASSACRAKSRVIKIRVDHLKGIARRVISR